MNLVLALTSRTPFHQDRRFHDLAICCCVIGAALCLLPNVAFGTGSDVATHKGCIARHFYTQHSFLIGPKMQPTRRDSGLHL